LEGLAELLRLSRVPGVTRIRTPVLQYCSGTQVSSARRESFRCRLTWLEDLISSEVTFSGLACLASDKPFSQKKSSQGPRQVVTLPTLWSHDGFLWSIP